jgi:hypothetical protein
MSPPTTPPLKTHEVTAMPQFRTYRIYVHLDNQWVWQCDVEAESHSLGLRQVAALIEPALDDKPIRVEQADPDEELSGATTRM